MIHCFNSWQHYFAHFLFLRCPFCNFPALLDKGISLFSCPNPRCRKVSLCAWIHKCLSVMHLSLQWSLYKSMDMSWFNSLTLSTSISEPPNGGISQVRGGTERGIHHVCYKCSALWTLNRTQQGLNSSAQLDESVFQYITVST